MGTPWQIELFGGLRATRGSHTVSRFRTRKTALLLAYLACYYSRSHPREELIELLWPGSPPDAGRNQLRMALTSLRRQLEPPGIPAGAVILADRLAVQFVPSACVTDVADFEQKLREAVRVGSGLEKRLRLAEAVDLYQGELLPGYFEDWIRSERLRLTEIYLEALEQLASLDEESLDVPGAIEWARRAVSADPLREEAQHHLIRLLAASGEADTALRQ